MRSAKARIRIYFRQSLLASLALQAFGQSSQKLETRDNAHVDEPTVSGDDLRRTLFSSVMAVMVCASYIIGEMQDTEVESATKEYHTKSFEDAPALAGKIQELHAAFDAEMNELKERVVSVALDEIASVEEDLAELAELEDILSTAESMSETELSKNNKIRQELQDIIVSMKRSLPSTRGSGMKIQTRKETNMKTRGPGGNSMGVQNVPIFLPPHEIGEETRYSM